jgi:alkaline phosphatase D
VSSPSTFTQASESPATHPHLKFADLLRHGYLLVDVTPERVQAEWYLVNNVRDRAEPETLSAVFQTRAGENHLVRVDAATLPNENAAPLAP